MQTYSKSDIYTFLKFDLKKPYAANCWSEDKGNDGYIIDTEVQEWFKIYFGPEAAHTYRHMQTECTGYLHLDNYVSRTMPIGSQVSDNFSPTLRSRIVEHGKHSARLESTDGSVSRRVTYDVLETMAYGV